MKTLWKNLGLILIIAGALTLVAAAVTNHINNTVLGTAAGIIVAGLVGYIVLNKRMK